MPKKNIERRNERIREKAKSLAALLREEHGAQDAALILVAALILLWEEWAANAES